MAHRDHHPAPVESCFGCKVLGLAFDSRQLARTITDEHDATVTEHRDGRQDVTVRPRTVRYGLSPKEA